MKRQQGGDPPRQFTLHAALVENYPQVDLIEELVTVITGKIKLLDDLFTTLHSLEFRSSSLVRSSLFFFSNE